MATQTAQGQDFDTEMKKTELGDYIIKNKGLVIGLTIIIIGVILGLGIYKNVLRKNNIHAAEKLYSFEIGDLKNFEAGNLTAKELTSNYSILASDLKTTDAYVSMSIIVFDKLYTKGHFSEALNVVEGLEAKNTHQAFFLDMRKAAAFEEVGQVDKAIAKLNAIVSGQDKMMEGKIYLDLGRLYLKNNNKEMAKKSFKHVQTLNTQKVYKSLASYYLESL